MKRVQVTLGLLVRQVEEAEPGVEAVTRQTHLTRTVMLPPVLCHGMVLNNRGEDDTVPFNGYRIDSLHMEVSSGKVIALMNLRTDKNSYGATLCAWRDAGWA